jgi:DNA-directed RNA polymerase specialized sigma24 family protein
MGGTFVQFQTDSVAVVNEPVAALAEDQSDIAALIRKVRTGESAAIEELRGVIQHGTRFMIGRALGAARVGDDVHHVFSAVLNAIQNGDLRQPESVIAYLRVTIKRQIAEGMTGSSQARSDCTDVGAADHLWGRSANADEGVEQEELRQVMLRVLMELPDRDRQALRRFYLLGQSEDQIQREMSLTAHKFRLLKSRAKARFAELRQSRLRHHRDH